MIVPMKRVTLLSFRPDQEQTLHELRELGLLHVTPVVAPDSEDLEKIQECLAAAREALDTLAAMKAAGMSLQWPGMRTCAARPACPIASCKAAT